MHPELTTGASMPDLVEKEMGQGLLGRAVATRVKAKTRSSFKFFLVSSFWAKDDEEEKRKGARYRGTEGKGSIGRRRGRRCRKKGKEVLEKPKLGEGSGWHSRPMQILYHVWADPLLVQTRTKWYKDYFKAFGRINFIHP